ncbi:MAG: hypothetical protein NWP64_00195 [Maribacter sp.]|nr:hypothetical protein [Maribacter sp.]
MQVGGLLLNADAGFDSRVFRKSCDKRATNANISLINCKGNADRVEYLDKALYEKR